MFPPSMVVKTIGLFRRRESRDPSSNIRFVRSRHFRRYVGIYIYKPLPKNFRTWEIPLCRVVPDCAEFYSFCLVTIPFLKLYSPSNSSIYLLSVLSETWQFVGLYIAENLATPAS